MRRLFSVLGIVSALFFSSMSADAATLEYFGREDCLHCQDLKEFLDDLVRDPEFAHTDVVYYDIYTEEGERLFLEVAEKSGESKATPFIFVANRFVVGFQSAASTGEYLKTLLRQSDAMESVLDVQSYLASDQEVLSETISSGVCEDGESCSADAQAFVFDLPFFGLVDLRSFSLPALSVILGFIDGFNPCAMYVLIMFITMLLNTGSRKKLIQIAGIFVLAEAVMYTLILTVWMSVWNFVGMNAIITPAVGLLSFGAGLYFLYEWRYNNGVCRLMSFEDQKKTKSAIANVITSPMSLATFFGIIALAFSVNVIEFACSIGIPQAFTKILDLNPMMLYEKVSYIFLYILFYMIDDFIVFGVAIYSFGALKNINAYSKWASGIGGVLMLILGVLLIFWPEALIVR